MSGMTTQSIRRLSRLIGVAAVASLAPCLAGTATAQQPRAPKGPVEITVGTGAGGTPDVVMRQTARVLAESGLVSQPLVIQNRTGGSWTVAANWVIGKPGSEGVLLALAGPIWSTPVVQGTPTVYDRVEPIAMFVRGEVIVGVQPNSGINNLKELLAKAGERERGLKIAGAQVGAVDHIVTGMLEKAGNVKFNYIPFDSGGAAQTSFLGNNSDMIVLSVAEAVALKREGKIKVLAILSEERRTDPEFKDVPTAREQGYDLLWDQTWGLAGPPNLDPTIIAWWDEKIAAMIKTDAWKKMVDENWFRTVHIPRAQVKQWVSDYHKKFEGAMRNAGLAKN
jgi:putative tricarboxylic transport membrane protein